MQGCQKWGARGLPPLPSDWGARGGRGCPSTKKMWHHKHTNKLKFKKNSKRKWLIFCSGSKSGPNLWCFNCANINNNKKKSRIWQNACFALLPRFAPAALDAHFVRFAPPVPENASGTPGYGVTCDKFGLRQGVSKCSKLIEPAISLQQTWWHCSMGFWYIALSIKF